jgi:hypothetical protein
MAVRSGFRLPEWCVYWIAYFCSAGVAPISGAVSLLFVIHLFRLTHRLEDSSGRGLIPPFVSNMLTFGIPVSYDLFGLVGMPIIFGLRRRNMLNHWTVHFAALGVIGVLFVGGAILGLQNQHMRIVGSIVGGAMALLLTPFAILSTHCFWWLVLRLSARRGP